MKNPTLISSFKNAINGLRIALRSERNFQYHLLALLLNLALIAWLQVRPLEAAVVLICCGLVLAIELLNTAVEKVCDFIHPEWNQKIGTIKDLSAGAVSIISFFSLCAAVLIYWPYLLKQLGF